MTGKDKSTTHSVGKPNKARPIRRALKGLLDKRPGSRASATYLELALTFPILPLRSEPELDEAIRVLDRLLSRPKPLDEQEQGYLESLSHEIDRYEAANVPMPEVSGTAMLHHLIEVHDLTLSKVAAATGIAVSTLSSVLSGKRKLNWNHVKKLVPFFGVAPGVFLA